MKIVLTQDVAGLGHKGEEKEVADGYARNYLIPKGLAVNSTDNKAKQLRENLEREQAAKQKEIEENQQKLLDIQGKVFTIKAKAEKDNLFAGVSQKEIAKVADLKAEQIHLDHPIKSLGEHKVKVVLPGGVESEITVVIEKA